MRMGWRICQDILHDPFSEYAGALILFQHDFYVTAFLYVGSYGAVHQSQFLRKLSNVSCTQTHICVQLFVNVHHRLRCSDPVPFALAFVFGEIDLPEADRFWSNLYILVCLDVFKRFFQRKLDRWCYAHFFIGA